MNTACFVSLQDRLFLLSQCSQFWRCSDISPMTSVVSICKTLNHSSLVLDPVPIPHGLRIYHSVYEQKRLLMVAGGVIPRTIIPEFLSMVHLSV